MRRPIRIALLAALAICSPAFAQQASDRASRPETWIDVNLASYHFGDASDYLAPGEHFNQRNYGAGVELQWQPRHAASAGYYRNSVFHDSWYALYHYTPLQLGAHVRVGAMVGLVNGYPGYNDGGVAPAGALVAKIENHRVGVNLIWLPPIPNVTPSTLGLQAKIRLGR